MVNKPGGQAIPGTLEVYVASADGYTMLGDGSTTADVMSVVNTDLPFKIMDRTFVASTFDNPTVLFVPFSSPFKTLGDFVAWAKKNPESVTFTLIGGTTPADFCQRQLLKVIGIDVAKTRPVMVKGGSEAVMLASGGNVVLGGSSVVSALPALNGNLIRGILITNDQRLPLLPDIPTQAEVGYPSVKFSSWVGISGPPKLPLDVVERWDKDLQEMLKDPDILSKIKSVGGVPFYKNARGIEEYVVNEANKIRKVLEK